MKRRNLFLVLIEIFALAGVGWLVIRRMSPPPSRSPGPANQIASVRVETLAENPDRFRGQLRVKGIVGRVLPEQRLFSLVDLSDREELLQKGETQCVTLPVRWTGPMPAAHDEVLVQGEVQVTDKKLLFVARTVSKPAQDSATGGQP